MNRSLQVSIVLSTLTEGVDSHLSKIMDIMHFKFWIIKVGIIEHRNLILFTYLKPLCDLSGCENWNI